MNNDSIILNLQARLLALESSLSLKEIYFTTAVIEYIELLNSTDVINRAITELALEKKINRETLQIIYNYSMVMLRKKSEGLACPGFYNEDIEKEYGLKTNFINLIKLENERVEISKRDKVSVDKIVLSQDKFEPLMSNAEELQEYKILNNQIIAKLSTTQEQDTVSKFDIETGGLFIGNKSIILKKFSDQYHVLRIIFKDPKKLPQEWFFSEICEEYDQALNCVDKKFYNAIYQIEIKLKSININDFFQTTRQSVKINKKYLS